MKTLFGFILTSLSVCSLANSVGGADRAVIIEPEYRLPALKYGLDPIQFKALLFVESSLDHKAVNPMTLDFGISQINYKTAEGYGIDTSRLLHDRAYSIERGAFILSEFMKRYKAKEPGRWVCRYNLGTRTTFTPKQAKLCSEYLRRIRLAQEMF